MILRTRLFINTLHNCEEGKNIMCVKSVIYLLLKCWRKVVKPHMWILQYKNERMDWLTLKATSYLKLVSCIITT